MRLKNIANSETNYEKLRNLGYAGQSFNDVISELVARVLTMEDTKFRNNVRKLRSDERSRRHAQTVASSPANSDTRTEVSR